MRFKERVRTIEAVQLQREHIFYNEKTSQWEVAPNADLPGWALSALSPSFWPQAEPSIRARTLHGEMTAIPSHWLVQGDGVTLWRVMPTEALEAIYEPMP